MIEKQIIERISYLKTELNRHGYWDGWSIKGMKKELKKLQKELKKIEK